MILNFKEYLESSYHHAVNAPGRAGQHVWKPETPVLRDPTPKNPEMKKSDLKPANIKSGFAPLIPAPFKGLTGKDFGIKIQKINSIK